MLALRSIEKLGIAVLLLLSLVAGQALAQPLVIAHRGASGYLPEHTLEAAVLAYAQGADYIEQDLVLSKDQVPVVLHDIHIDTVTNVAEKYPQRKRADGRFYAIDFTLAELKTLTVKERADKDGQQVFANRYRGSAGFTIATFEEHIELVAELNRQFDKSVGLYPEIKAPAWHRDQGVDISKVVLELMRAHGLDDADKAIYLQCFDFEETQRLRKQLGAKVKLIQLLADNSWQESSTDYDYLQTPEGLQQIASVAQGIGPWMAQLLDLATLEPTELASHAHAAGLDIHTYTLRRDALPETITLQQLLDALFNRVATDGVFTDFSDDVVNYLAAQKQDS